MNIIERNEEVIGFVDDIREEARSEYSWESVELFEELKERENELVRCTFHQMGAWNVERLSFDERIEFYKNEGCDFFIVDIYKGGDLPFNTKRDLTWTEAKRIVARAKWNKSVSRIDLMVEDYGFLADGIYKVLEQIDKTPVAWHTSLAELMNGNDFLSHPYEWRYEK